MYVYIIGKSIISLSLLLLLLLLHFAYLLLFIFAPKTTYQEAYWGPIYAQQKTGKVLILQFIQLIFMEHLLGVRAWFNIDFSKHLQFLLALFLNIWHSILCNVDPN